MLKMVKAWKLQLNQVVTASKDIFLRYLTPGCTLDVIPARPDIKAPWEMRTPTKLQFEWR